MGAKAGEARSVHSSKCPLQAEPTWEAEGNVREGRSQLPRASRAPRTAMTRSHDLAIKWTGVPFPETGHIGQMSRSGGDAVNDGSQLCRVALRWSLNKIEMPTEWAFFLRREIGLEKKTEVTGMNCLWNEKRRQVGKQLISIGKNIRIHIEYINGSGVS